MWEDPIVNEVRRIREIHAARFDYDLQAIYRDLKGQEMKSGRTFVSYPSRSCQSIQKTVPAQNS